MRALSLFSGGLDSQLAVKLIQELGVEVIGLHFTTPFFTGNSQIEKAAQDLGMEYRDIDISSDYIPRVLLNPVYGYGKNFNPCIDCHAYMLHTAGNMMKENEASFIISGEVVGQRPMSQNKAALNAVDKLSGYRGYVVRPLSALLLNPSIPEKEGWIDRNRLLDISGRGRSRQIGLAEEYGLNDYPSPAGGCLLTESNFARRLRKMLQYKELPSPEEMQILKLGRHFYIDDTIFLVVGRNHSENQKINDYALDNDLFIKVADRPGPLALVRGLNTLPSDSQLEYAASIVARYSDAKNQPEASIKIFNKIESYTRALSVIPLSVDKVPKTV